jgi:methylated-DNA-[protein]-cysteine S-methyltransferase
MEKTEQTAYYKSPIGSVKITGSEKGISSIKLMDEDILAKSNISDFLGECIKQLDEYFRKERTEFQLKLNPQGTEFQKEVWKALLNIPYGKTITYSQQAKDLGDIKKIRAVAAANGKNPVWIVIPCHRVIGSDGNLTGYAGGLWRKKWLLEHENPSNQQSLF